ncbi:radical SAM/SPASM domain-containing protein [Clostridioides difficile]
MKAELKPSYDFNRMELHKILPLETPFTLNIVSSTVCNFKCKYCIHSLDKDSINEKNFIPKIMNWEMFKKIISQAKEFNKKFKTVTLTGIGEPMCNKNLAAMIRYIKDSNISESIEFVTNGSLLEKDNILDMIDSGLDRIRISIQGLSSKKYDEICGFPVDFEKFIDKIKFLNENKKQCKVFIKTLDIALDKNGEGEFYNIFGDICDRIFIERVRPIFPGVDYNSMIKENKIMNFYGEVHKKILVCPTIFFTITIWPNGDVYPCCSIEDPSLMGNIRYSSLKEIWNGDKRKDFLFMQLNKERNKNHVCKNCEMIYSLIKEEDILDDYVEELKVKYSDEPRI